MRFADRTRHQIFIEPEGLSTFEIYPNGISTSLPFDVQLELVHSIPGFENAHVTRPGYAIEYDFFDPRDLKFSLETKAIENLFFAGQINGTTGYEEAAAQGIVAGINAGLRVRGREPWYPRREEAYIGVLIDDLDHARHDRAVSHVHEPRRVPLELARGQRRPAPDARRPRARARARRALAAVRSAARLAREGSRASARHRRAAGRRARRRRIRGAARRAKHRPTRCCAGPVSSTRTWQRSSASAARRSSTRSTPSSSSNGRAASRSRRTTPATSSGRARRSSGRSARPARGCRRISTTRGQRPVERAAREARAHPAERLGQAARISGMTPAAISLLLDPRQENAPRAPRELSAARPPRGARHTVAERDEANRDPMSRAASAAARDCSACCASSAWRR